MMRSPLLRHEYREWRALQRARAFRFSVFTALVVTGCLAIGAMAAQSAALTLGVFFGSALLGLGIHTLTRPMP